MAAAPKHEQPRIIVNMRISPYVLYRRGRLPVAMLDGLAFTESWRRFDEAARQRADAERLAGRLSDELSAVIAGLDGDARSDVVTLRRDIYNARTARVDDRLATLGGVLPDSCVEDVRSWCRRQQSVQDVLRQAHASLRDEYAASEALLGDLFRHDAIAGSIQLSGSSLYASMARRFGPAPAPLKPSKLRSIETSLVNFLYRAAYKPSPFARFTEVGAFASSARCEPPDESRAFSHVTVNRVLVNWLIGSLAQVPGGLETGVLSLNSSLQRVGPIVRFIGKSRAWHDHGYCGFEMIRLRIEPVVERLLTLLSDGPVEATKVLADITPPGGDAEHARTVLDALMRVGFLVFGTGIDDQDPRYGAKLAALLSRAQTPEASALAECFDDLLRLEAGFAGASLDQREELLSAARRGIQTATSSTGVTPPPEESMKSLVYEDMASPGASAAWRPDCVTDATKALTSLWRLASLLDYGQVKRLALYAFALERFPEGGPVAFLDFYEQFARLSPADQDRLLAGTGSELVSEFRTARRRAVRRIRDAARESGDGVLHIDPDAVAQACDSVCHVLDPDSITFRVQFTRHARQGQDTLVVNGVHTGYGVFFSRFCGFIPAGPDGWSLEESVRGHLRDVFPAQTDLNAVFGLNFNLHPELTKNVLDYPGGCISDRTQTRYSLDEIELHPDHARKTLRMRHARTGAELNLVGMNFLIPVWAPPLYKLLEALSPTTLYPWRLLSDLQADADVDAFPSSAPRLCVGDVVAERRSWTIAAQAVPLLDELAADDLAAVVDFDEWRRAQGWPRHAFVLCQSVDEYNVLSGRNLTSVKSWQDLTHMRRAGVHKPMYVDFRNPRLLRSLARAALSRPGLHVSVRECLPAPDDYDAEKGTHSAEEFFVELHRGQEPGAPR
ncbi:lantibiotic dehydratase [Sphaerisporangium fuscum]|uniref:lantibiotic dehydratase n=1 Tax=Sphaerisporangium fuscum TaxID=2835868 RepID=UPI001BDD4B68|nr:lantibiotic dehydratase [Sphaerisporangium fuscum]